MRILVCFSKRDVFRWWNVFTGEFAHCFILFAIEDKIYRLDDSFTGSIFVEDTKLECMYNVIDWVCLDIKEPTVKYWTPTLTCAGFCAKFVGVSGLIITPKQLYRRLLK